MHDLMQTIPSYLNKWRSPIPLLGMSQYDESQMIFHYSISASLNQQTHQTESQTVRAWDKQGHKCLSLTRIHKTLIELTKRIEFPVLWFLWYLGSQNRSFSLLWPFSSTFPGWHLEYIQGYVTNHFPNQDQHRDINQCNLCVFLSFSKTCLNETWQYILATQLKANFKKLIICTFNLQRT